jgi:hypothetical protein
MRNYFEAFGKLLVELNGPNLVVCGSNVLLAHGLNFSREPGDLDVAIYTPTEDQAEKIAVLKEFSKPGKSNPNIMKFEREGLELDLLVHPDRVVPDDLLYYEHNGTYYKVQSVDNLVEAKRGYKRDKDYEDFSDLKDRNFNM